MIFVLLATLLACCSISPLSFACYLFLSFLFFFVGRIERRCLCGRSGNSAAEIAVGGSVLCTCVLCFVLCEAAIRLTSAVAVSLECVGLFVQCGYVYKLSFKSWSCILTFRPFANYHNSSLATNNRSYLTFRVRRVEGLCQASPSLFCSLSKCRLMLVVFRVVVCVGLCLVGVSAACRRGCYGQRCSDGVVRERHGDGR